jgi:4-amino-4-deoxy-L-arabinose transferase-like glycosyltransferase
VVSAKTICLGDAAFRFLARMAMGFDCGLSPKTYSQIIMTYFLTLLQSSSSKKWVAILLGLWALGLRTQRLWQRDLDGDEVFQHRYMDGTFKPFWMPIYNYGDHSGFPGQYLINYPFVKIFGLSKWGLAIPQIAATIIGFYLLYKICQRYYQSSLGYVVAFAVTGCNQMLIYHSFQFRPYAILPTLALASFYFADKVVRDYGQLTGKTKFLIVLFYAYVGIFHAYGIMIFALPMCYQLLLHRKESYGKLLLSPPVRFFALVSLLVFVIWCWYASVNNFGLNPAHDRKYATTTIPQAIHDTFQYIPNPQENFIGFLKGIFGNLVGYKLFYPLMLAIPLSLCLPVKEKLPQLAFFLTLVILPLLLILNVDIINHMWFLQRQFVWIMPLFALLLGWQWDSIAGYLQKRLSR